MLYITRATEVLSTTRAKGVANQGYLQPEILEYFLQPELQEQQTGVFSKTKATRVASSGTFYKQSYRSSKQQYFLQTHATVVAIRSTFNKPSFSSIPITSTFYNRDTGVPLQPQLQEQQTGVFSTTRATPGNCKKC